MGHNKISFVVDVVCESSVDTAAVQSALAECLSVNTPDEALCNIGEPTVKALSVQGFKVWRSRVMGVTAEQAGDAANPKSKPAETLDTAGATA
jgi:hypothetical protein